MRWLLSILAAWTLLQQPLAAAEARIIKVLPHLLDKDGKHSLSPSLYERDAYQVVLRGDPTRVQGMRFDVQWKAPTKGKTYKIKIELRASGTDIQKPVVFEQSFERRGWRSTWSGITLTREQYLQIGQVVAWRASLWDGDQMVSEQKSFLW